MAPWRWRVAGSFRTYTLVLCMFYLLLVLSFHSSLQPHKPRGLSAHVGESPHERTLSPSLLPQHVPFPDDQLAAVGDVVDSQHGDFVDSQHGDVVDSQHGGVVDSQHGDVVDSQHGDVAVERKADALLYEKHQQQQEQLKRQQERRDRLLEPQLLLQKNVMEQHKAPSVQLPSFKHQQSKACNGQPFDDEQQFLMVSQEIYVFSAYWDTRPNDFDNLSVGIYVRLMAVVHSRVAHMRRTVYCIFDDGTVVSATYYEMCENHGRPYGGYILSCSVPVNIKQTPCSIQVSTKNKPTSDGLRVAVQLTEPQQQHDFAVCVSPLFGELDPVRFVEWAELMTALGAQRITLYHSDIAVEKPTMKVVLRHYEGTGLVQLVRWPVPSTVESNIWYHGQLVAIQDCLYRNMASARYVAFHDLDEAMVPHIHANWSALIGAIDNSNTCGFQFNSAFFDPMRQKPFSGSTHEQMLLTLTDTQRSVSTSRVRTKCLIKPASVFEAGIHHISKPIFARFDTQRVDLPVALLHHYRTCMANYNMDCRKFQQDAAVAERYGPRLVREVIGVIAQLKDDLLKFSDDEGLKQILKHTL